MESFFHEGMRLRFAEKAAEARIDDISSVRDLRCLIADCEQSLRAAPKLTGHQDIENREDRRTCLKATQSLPP
jgi:hypothetical protein